MHKLDKYLQKLTKDYVISVKSRYYKFNNTILRVSDHIGKNSEGNYSIIISNENYILHNHKNGLLSVISYEECLCLIKSINILSDLIETQENLFWEKEQIHVAQPKNIVTEEKVAVYIAYTKLSKNARSKFRKDFKINPKVNFTDFSTWSETMFNMDMLRRWFKEKSIIVK